MLPVAGVKMMISSSPSHPLATMLTSLTFEVPEKKEENSRLVTSVLRALNHFLRGMFFCRHEPTKLLPSQVGTVSCDQNLKRLRRSVLLQYRCTPVLQLFELAPLIDAPSPLSETRSNSRSQLHRGQQWLIGPRARSALVIVDLIACHFILFLFS